jgi:hypothetical protein
VKSTRRVLRALLLSIKWDSFLGGVGVGCICRHFSMQAGWSLRRRPPRSLAMAQEQHAIARNPVLPWPPAISGRLPFGRLVECSCELDLERFANFDLFSYLLLRSYLAPKVMCFLIPCHQSGAQDPGLFPGLS